MGPALAAPFCNSIVTSAPGRARQMNAGAAKARGDVLLFLHADTRLPADFARQIEDALERRAVWGRFDVRIEGQSRWLPLIAWMMMCRCSSLK